MGRWNRLAVLILALALAGGLARATVQPVMVAGIELVTHIRIAETDLWLNGAGLRRILLLKVYVAALYLPDRQHDSHAILDRDMPRALRLTLLRDLSTDQNLEALKRGLMNNNTPAELEAIQGEVERFLGLIRQLHEVPAGTVIQLDYQPGRGTRVSVNDRLLGTVPGDTFNRAVLRIWLGDDPVQTSLKRALLGQG